MKAVPVNAKKREDTGKGVARKLRASGAIPAVLYGEQTTPVALEMDRHEITTILRKSTSEHILVDLTVANNGGTPEMALVREVQHDPVTSEILHVDFLHISATKKIRITVPVHIVGIADGVKNFGGLLQHISRELEIESLPADIPEMIDADVTELGIGDAIHVSDLQLEGITFVTPADRTVVSVIPPTVVKEVVAAEEDAEAAEEGTAGEPEVIGEKKEGAEASGDDKKKSGDDKKKKG